MTDPISRRMMLASGTATLAAFAVPVLAQDTEGAARAVEPMIMGAEDAPVTVIKYASLTCPHCAAFHKNVYKDLKANYIDTGKVKYEVRDVYFDRYGLWAAMVARCGGAERYFGVSGLLYDRQSDWSRQSEPADAIAAIFAIGRQAGMSDETMNACVQDQAWAEALVTEYQNNAQADAITATPTFLINGEKHSNMGYEAFAARIDAALAS